MLSRPFISGNEKRFSSAWKFFGITRNLNFNLRRNETTSGRLLIKAVATLEPKCTVNNNNNEDKHSVLNNPQLGIDKSSPAVQTESSSDDSEDLDEKERLRRMRISKANKGNTPWNKGRKHSPGKNGYLI